MDAAVDSGVGDRVRYWHNGKWLGVAPVGYTDPVVEAFVIIAAAPVNLDGIDEILGNRKRIKISREYVDEPLRSDRIAHPLLGEGWFRPAGGQPETEGRYVIFDVQKASAP